MEVKSMQIFLPKGFEVDKEKSTFEKIIFKPINSKPKTWEEFCEKRCGIVYYSSQNDGYIHKLTIPKEFCNPSTTQHLLPSKELVEAFLAMMQLMSLRQAWIDDWKPDWKKFGSSNIKWTIQFCEEEPKIYSWNQLSHPLSFPSETMAKEFLNCFKNLIEIAKPLL